MKRVRKFPTKFAHADWLHYVIGRLKIQDLLDVAHRSERAHKDDREFFVVEIATDVQEEVFAGHVGHDLVTQNEIDGFSRAWNVVHYTGRGSTVSFFHS